MTEKTLILIDGHALAYRMYFALERTNMQNKAGEPTWAVYGFYNALFSLLKNYQPSAIAVAFDVQLKTFRNDLYEDYKANRASMPDDMKVQMHAIREGVGLLGIPIFEAKGYEADDVIGTLATKARRDGYHVQILTGDQDAFQLVVDPSETPDKAELGSVEVLVPGRLPKEPLKHYNREAVYQKWGVYPEQVIDFKGLKGDTSDNIPGVPGVGDKTAAKLLNQFETLEALYQNIEQLPKNKMREKLETFQEQAVLSKQLATICCELPDGLLPPIHWDDCALHIPDTAALFDYFNRLSFNAFLRQAPELLAPFSRNPAEASTFQAQLAEEANARNDSPQPLAIEYDCITTESALADLMQVIKTTRVFAIDLETTSLDVLTTDIVGIAISVEAVAASQGFSSQIVPESRVLVNWFNLPKRDGADACLTLKNTDDDPLPLKSVYIPLRHADAESQLSESMVLELLSPVLEDADIVKIVHNLKFECNVFRQKGIRLEGLVFDTMLASYCHNPDEKHGLKALAESVLNVEMTEIKTLIGTGKSEITFDRVPLAEAGYYAACDAYATYKLACYFLSAMSSEALALFYEVEAPLARVIADMEWTGVSLDTAYLQTLSETLDEKLKALESQIYDQSGGPFNLNSPKQVGEILFETLGIPPTKKTKGKTGYSTDVKVLEQLKEAHPIIPLILDYRGLFKLKSTYIDALPALVHASTGRLHTNFNQTVTATGRLSSSNPNLQNIPIRTDLGRQIRKAFIPRAKTENNSQNWVLLAADYSQIELRFLAHFSEDPPLVEAFNTGQDVHTATASLVFGVPVEAVTKDQRYQAKTVNFGVIYGQSPFGLSQQLGISQREASDFIQRYFSRYGQVRQFIDAVKREAHANGSVSTICGRKRNLATGLNSKKRSEREFAERAAFNTPLQGSAADLLKVAMIELHRELGQQGLQSKILLQVHDELVLEVPENELGVVKALVEASMGLGQPLRVPLVIDTYVGESWIEV